MKELDLTGFEKKMNSELRALMTYTCTKLDEAGLIDVTNTKLVHSTTHIYCSPEELAIFESPKRYETNRNYLSVEVVDRSNGTSGNTSIRIYRMFCSQYSGHVEHKVKFSYKDSKKKIDRLIQEAIDDFRKETSHE